MQGVTVESPGGGASRKHSAERGPPRRLWHLAFCTSGLTGSLIVYGLMQERIMTTPWGQGVNAKGVVVSGEYYDCTAFLIFCNRFITWFLALYAGPTGRAVAGLARRAAGRPSRAEPPPADEGRVPWYWYGFISAANMVATTAQYEALKWLSFPMQTLGKTTKMLPVMFAGVLFFGKTYGSRDYLVAVLVVLGCSMFALSGDIRSSRLDPEADGSSAFFGFVLMAFYMCSDGCTSNLQEHILRVYNVRNSTVVGQVAFFSSVVTLAAVLLQGKFSYALRFVMRYPDLRLSVVAVSASAVASQFFIMATIRAYGALLFAATMTTRQIFSVILSCVYFRRPLTQGQIVGVGIVFGALYAKSLWRQAGAPKAH